MSKKIKELNNENTWGGTMLRTDNHKLNDPAAKHVLLGYLEKVRLFDSVSTVFVQSGPSHSKSKVG